MFCLLICLPTSSSRAVLHGEKTWRGWIWHSLYGSGTQPIKVKYCECFYGSGTQRIKVDITQNVAVKTSKFSAFLNFSPLTLTI